MKGEVILASEESPLVPAPVDVFFYVLVLAGVALMCAALVVLFRGDAAGLRRWVWAAVIVLVPIVGPAVFLLVNRSGRKAKEKIPR
ncbi:PLD nuclease N-terminal domain-containing protein [Corynebacterium frankenforstense]